VATEPATDTTQRRLPTPVPLGVLVGVVAALNVWWRVRETRPPHWDMGHHLSNSLIYLHDFDAGKAGAILTAYRFYPPLVYWVADGFYAALGSTAMWVAVLSNVVWLAVLVFSTYAVGRRLWSSRVGWLSVTFVVTAPMTVSASKEFMLDLPLTATAALTLYLVLRADGFSSLRFSLLLGAACGCGLLVKWTFPLVVGVPLLHASATALAVARQERRYGRLANLGGSVVVAAVIAGAWWVHNFTHVAAASIFYGGDSDVAAASPGLATPESVLWYLWNLLDQQVYLVPVLMVAVGLVYCIRRRGFASRNLYPLLMVCGTYVAFTLIQHKDPRYTLPMLPALAIVATSWVDMLAATARRVVTAGFVAYGAAAFLAVSFGTALLPDDVSLDVPAGAIGLRHVTLFGQHGYLVGPPTREDWHQSDAVSVMTRVPRADRTFAFLGRESIWFNKFGIDYYARRIGAHWRPRSSAHFLIARGSAPVTPPGLVQVARWQLPDGGTLAVFRRPEPG
jgi:dolichyl-phosphate-mannose-protein mannosyltransferase